VEGGYVRGWDDPRMPTLSALRRRGYTANAIRDFISRIGLSKADSVVDTAVLEACVRQDLDQNAARVSAVLRPIKVVLTNWPEGEKKELVVENHPKNPDMGTHTVTLSREIYIDAEDFMEVPVGKFQRMYPGFEVRLKGACIVKCEGCTKDENGNVVEIQCTVDFDSFAGCEGSGRKIKGKVIHWVNAEDAVPFEARLYEPLLPAEGEAVEEAEEEVAADVDAEEANEETDALTRKDYDFLKKISPNTLTILRGYAEPAIRDCENGTSFQFVRVGYFCKDPDSTNELPVFNRTVELNGMKL